MFDTFDSAMDEVLALSPGKLVALEGRPGTGLTRVGLSMLAGRPGPVAVLDVRGWFCPLAAWECGILPERLVVVRCSDRQRWPQVAGALLEGVPALYAEVPLSVPVRVLRRLAAVARARGTSAALRPLEGALPPGVASLRVQGEGLVWEGPDEGRGRLGSRRLALLLSGQGTGGREVPVEMEDDGTGLVRVVPRLAPAEQAGGTAG